jgi:hypothetical protein
LAGFVATRDTSDSLRPSLAGDVRILLAIIKHIEIG